MNRSRIRTHIHVVVVLLAVVIAGLLPPASDAATIKVVNNCGYTVFPGLYPPTFRNGGWQQPAGTTVTFDVGAGWIGRLWPRKGCNGASPAQCATGSCGGTGLQCAGTTGQPNASLFEINVNASGTDWYDVSFVDAVNAPMGLKVDNASCASPARCESDVISQCPDALKSGTSCLSPCTQFNTDQYCCRGAFGTQATCVVANWPAVGRQYVQNVHTYCPHKYAYAYDEGSGALHTCPSNGNTYTVTFCPGR